MAGRRTAAGAAGLALAGAAVSLALAGGAMRATVAVGAGQAPAATAPRVVKAADPRGDVADGAPDLTRVSVARASTHDLRATMTLARSWSGKDLLTKHGGQPGSLCVKAWVGVPAGTTEAPLRTPDRLVCVTAQADGALRGTVLRERPNQLPERAGSADVSRPSSRTVALRFAASALGGGGRVALGGEAVRPGCSRVTCTDLAPDAPAVMVLTVAKGP